MEMCTYEAIDLLLIFLFLLLAAIMAVGVNGFMFANLGFSADDVESQSTKRFLWNWEPIPGKEHRLGAPSSSKISLDLRGSTLGAEQGEHIAQTLFGEVRPSNRRMAFMVFVGGEGELSGLSRNRFLGSLGHCNIVIGIIIGWWLNKTDSMDLCLNCGEFCWPQNGSLNSGQDLWDYICVWIE